MVKLARVALGSVVHVILLHFTVFAGIRDTFHRKTGNVLRNVTHGFKRSLKVLISDAESSFAEIFFFLIFP